MIIKLSFAIIVRWIGTKSECRRLQTSILSTDQLASVVVVDSHDGTEEITFRFLSD